jgi:hypothetical protein
MNAFLLYYYHIERRNTLAYLLAISTYPFDQFETFPAVVLQK